MTSIDVHSGRPGLDDETVRDIASRLEAGQTPKEIIADTGVSQTKVYEIRRTLRAIEKKALTPREGDPGQGPAQPDAEASDSQDTTKGAA